MLKDGNVSSQDDQQKVLRHLRHHFGKDCFDPKHQIQMICSGHSEIVVDTMEYAYEDGGVKEIINYMHKNITNEVAVQLQRQLNVGNNADGYKRGRPLPVIPRIRSRLPRGTQTLVPRGGVLRQ